MHIEVHMHMMCPFKLLNEKVTNLVHKIKLL